MLPSKRNELTISILNKLKQKGYPSQGEEPAAELDMGFGAEEEAAEAYSTPEMLSNNKKSKRKKKSI